MNENNLNKNPPQSNQKQLFKLLVIATLNDTKLFACTQTDAVISEVAGHIEDQIKLLPKYLRFGINLAVTVFNLESVIFNGKTFTHLQKPAQIKHLRRWETSRFRTKRDLLRFIRSLALFNYYDHADIRSRI
jgi:hypothetical protein